MKQRNVVSYIISCVIVCLFLVTAFGSDEDSGSSRRYEGDSSYQDEPSDELEQEVAPPKIESEPDFTINAAEEKDVPVEIEPDFTMDEEIEEPSGEYRKGTDIDTTFKESAEPEPDFE